jgi:hypothetical protein
MKKIIQLTCLAILITVLLTACGSTTDNQAPSASTQGPVAVQDVTKTYTGIFVNFWNASSDPVLFALIQSSAEWNAVFGNTGMGSGPPFASIYDTDELLVVSRVVPVVSGMNPDDVFQIESVEGGNDLVVKYRYVPPSGSPNWYQRLYFTLQFTKQPYQRVFLVENGNQIGILNVANGQWSVPALLP